MLRQLEPKGWPFEIEPRPLADGLGSLTSAAARLAQSRALLQMTGKTLARTVHSVSASLQLLDQSSRLLHQQRRNVL
jgi:hypothetical protein